MRGSCMIIFATLVVWFVLAIATGFAAQSRGRDGPGWFLLAILISPPLALILLIAFPSRFVGPSKICQFCTSQVAEAALVCSHCHKEIDTPEGTQARRTARERQRRQNYIIAGIVASDFSLMDAIESSIVKLPRVPVTDNLPQTDSVVYRHLWTHIGKDPPKTAAGANSSAHSIFPICFERR